jgi:hypothetical protein
MPPPMIVERRDNVASITLMPFSDSCWLVRNEADNTFFLRTGTSVSVETEVKLFYKSVIKFI